MNALLFSMLLATLPTDVAEDCDVEAAIQVARKELGAGSEEKRVTRLLGPLTWDALAAADPALSSPSKEEIRLRAGSRRLFLLEFSPRRVARDPVAPRSGEFVATFPRGGESVWVSADCKVIGVLQAK